MPGKLYIQTFGCQMNEYDSRKMADVLRESHGLQLTDRPEGGSAPSAGRPRPAPGRLCVSSKRGAGNFTAEARRRREGRWHALRPTPQAAFQASLRDLLIKPFSPSLRAKRSNPASRIQTNFWIATALRASR